MTPTPLDEVRSALAIFDETLFTVVPRLHAGARPGASTRATVGRPPPPAGEALAADAGRTGTRAAATPALLRFGSWIGADRDGHPGVTADITLHAARLQADHLLRGYEAVAMRLMQTVAARVAPERLDRALESALARDAEELPETVRQFRRRFPDEPYRQRLGTIAERIRRTRAAMIGEASPRTGGYASAGALDAELASLQHALVEDGLGRVAWGEVADLRWQLATFGFHLASLEVRQHAAVHRAALEALRAGASADPDLEVAAGVTLGEVLATFRAMARAPGAVRRRACRRYVISFTTSPDDVAAVLELARIAARPEPFGRPVAGARRPPGGPPGARRRAPARDRGRPRRRGASSSTRLLTRSGLPRSPPRPGRRPGGDARLLGLVQGERVPRGELAALPRPGGARRDRSFATASR